MKKNFTQCPNCKRRIGVFPIARALIPVFFHCPECKTRLRAKGVSWRIFGLFMLAGIAAGAYLTNAKDPTFWIPIAFIVVAQVGSAYIIFNKATLVFKNKKTQDKTE